MQTTKFYINIPRKKQEKRLFPWRFQKKSVI